MSVAQAFNFHKIDEQVSTAGVVSEDQLRGLGAESYEVLINLLPRDSDYAIADEQQIVEGQGLTYHYIPVDFSAPSAKNFSDFEQAMYALSGKKVMIHCAANYRVSAFYAMYARRHLGWSSERAQELIASIWNPQDYPPWPEFIAGT